MRKWIGGPFPKERSPKGWIVTAGAVLLVLSALTGGLFVFSLRPTSSAHAQSATGGWWLTSSLPAARIYHTATLLPNGKVLVVGGDDSSLNPQATAYLYDPATGTWTVTGSMQEPRAVHTATLLPNGKVLVAGGVNRHAGNPIASAELYDPTTGIWTATGSLQTPRAVHTATLLPNGQVLVAGGDGSNGITASAELYDPATGTWTATASMQVSRSLHTATLLPNGQVLVAGGFVDDTLQQTSAAELYNPATGTWTPTGSMQTLRNRHTATLLPNGKVLVAGGTAFTSSAELYDPATGLWMPTGLMHTDRVSHTETLLPNGQVLVAGGGHDMETSSELYNPLGPPSLNGTYQGLLMGSGGRAFDSITLQVTQVGSTLTGTLTVQGEPLSLISGSTMSSTGLVVIRARSSTASTTLNGAMTSPGHLPGSYTGFFPTSFPGSGTWTLTQV